MTIVTVPQNNLIYYKSYKGRITYLDGVFGKKVIKLYKNTLKRSIGASNIIELTRLQSVKEWQALTPAQKTTWNNKAKEFGMEGYQLYIQEGFKQGFNAISGVGISNFCYSNGVIDP